MTENYQVETGDIAISDALRKIGADNGWTGFLDQNRWYPWLIISHLSPDGGSNDTPMDGYKTVTVPEFIALLRKGPEPTEHSPIVVMGSQVEFRTNGVLIPCTAFIDTKTWDAIHARLHEKRM